MAKVLFRSFYIQGAWNFERMLGLGVCFCLIPIARRLCRTKEEMADFLSRHLEYFNAHPYMASFALGSISKLEELAIRQNWKDKKPIAIFKNRIIGPLGVIGDALFWNSIKPLASGVGIIFCFFWGVSGVIVFLVLFNFAHLYLRIHGLYFSYQAGFDTIRLLSIRGTKKYFNALKKVLNFIIGGLFGSMIFWIMKQGYGKKELVLFGFLTMISYLMTKKRKISIESLMAIIIIISIIIGLVI